MTWTTPGDLSQSRKSGEQIVKYVFTVIAVFLLAACAEPLPEDQKKFVGLWKNNSTSLLITEAGRLEYETSAGAVNKSVSLPIKHISDSEIVAGFLFLNSTFKLAGAPAEEEGLVTLTVDGKKLYKTDKLGRFPQATKIPDMTKLRALVTEELTLLADAINNQDFNPYIENASLLFQSQYTNDRLLDVYKPFIQQKINLKEWMVGDFILTREPSIDENGFLQLAGKYPTSPNSLKFNFSYVYSPPKWKSLGPDISINDK